MVVYGLTLLAGCMFLGMFCGDVLGVVTGVDSNVGGVGFAMLALILISSKLTKEGKLSEKAQSGITFWSAMYIPVVVAMTACQDVASAIVGGGALAIISGIVVVVIPLLLVPVLQKLGKPSDPLPPIEQG
ncbi:malonate transporter subunit MadL [Rubneribacter badeniensis]|uniref:Malonate transporter subunit MadL n=1 Tax=Rubneribacter badeniensis TaxID=2070688 RepID=A0A2K2U6W1_9ACTN|nr:malonate transporter subunit MadL [Rubneribacter badeniensis]OUO96144.1 malonate transporter subunit MadL [Gordonibacter sp. An232A]PNV66073.1 malonate transporter subunit MadL [Rubneribacter badeniensis]